MPTTDEQRPPHGDAQKPAAQVEFAKKADALKAAKAGKVKAAALINTPGLDPTEDAPSAASAHRRHDERYVHGQRAPPERRGSSDDELDVWLTFAELKRVGIVDSWQTLIRWQNDPRIDFPKGRLFGPNTRRWNKQKEIDPWLASRPVEREAFEDAAAEA
jgi:hypothetical protein